jgi:hypothetical protein
VKEMRGIGIDGQTMKSFLMDWQQRTAAGSRSVITIPCF